MALSASVTVLGLVSAVLSAVFNGSFPIPSKIKCVEEIKLDPLLFVLYFSCGVFLSGWLAVPAIGPMYYADINSNTSLNFQLSGSDHYVFSPWGILAGSLLIASVSCAFTAIEFLGSVALAQGIWCGVAIITSIVWGCGIIQPRNTIKSIAGLASAVVVLVVSVVAIAMVKEISDCIGKMRDGNGKASGLLGDEESLQDTFGSTGGGEGDGGGDGECECDGDGEDEGGAADVSASKPGLPERTQRMLGLILAVMTGVFGGSILVPLSYASPAAKGLVFIPSFGVGAIAAAPLVVLVNFLIRRTRPRLHLGRALLPGMLSGLVFNISNLFSIFAIPVLGYGVAYPILQCALFFAGLWGIFVLKEESFQGCLPKVLFFVFGTVLVGGAGILAVSVTPS